MIQYFYYFGGLVNYGFSKLPSFINSMPPISLIFDYDGTDIHQMKLRYHFYTFIGVCMLVAFWLIQVFRRIFCVRIIKIKKRIKVDKE